MFFDFYCIYFYNIMNQQEYSLIPDDAFLYFPTAQQLKVGTNRKIFDGNTKFDDTQLKKLEEFEQYLQKKKIVLDSYWTPSLRIRFLQSCSYSYEKTNKHMIEYLKWRKQNTPAKLTKTTEKYLKQGIFYMCGRDHKYRPILVIDIKKMIDLNISTSDLLTLQTYYFEYIISQAMIPGQVENWVAIIDLNYVGMFSVAGVLKQAISFLSNTFRCRMHCSYLVRCPGSISFLWGMVKSFLQQTTIKKISIYDSHIAEPLYSHANKSQVQLKFGGQLENIKEFWYLQIYQRPPVANLNENSLNQLQKIQFLISSKQYSDMYYNNQLLFTKINKKFIKPKHKSDITQRWQQEIPEEGTKNVALFFTTHSKPITFCSYF